VEGGQEPHGSVRVGSRWVQEVEHLAAALVNEEPDKEQDMAEKIRTANRVARSFLAQAPFTHQETAAIGSGNWEQLTGHVATSGGHA
jgi:hypothetical protein